MTSESCEISSPGEEGILSSSSRSGVLEGYGWSSKQSYEEVNDLDPLSGKTQVRSASEGGSKGVLSYSAALQVN